MTKKDQTPPEKRSLKERLLDALRFYETSVEVDNFRFETNASGEVTDVSLIEGEWSAVSESTDTTIFLRYEEDLGYEMTIGEFLELTQEVQEALKNPENFTDGSLRTRKRMIVFIDFADNLSRARMHKAEEIEIFNDKGVSVRVYSGSYTFGLALMARGRHLIGRFYPAVSSEDFYIDVCWKEAQQPLDDLTARNYIEAALFAMHEELGISAYRSSRGSIDEDEEESDVEGKTAIARPLMIGAGMTHLLSVYNKSHEPGNPEFEFLQIAKTIEFVAATVVRRNAHQDVRKRLNSSDALRPNAAFIAGLITLVQQQSSQRDPDAMKAAVTQCCDAHLLAALAPPCAKQLTRLAASAAASKKGKADPRSNVDPTEALVELASILYSTRCQFAHGKANYTLKGDECPEDQLSGLIACARSVARQCIRWYNDLSEHERLF